MAIIYATLIVKGKKTYAQVPEKIKPQVKQVLIDLECEDLITGGVSHGTIMQYISVHWVSWVLGIISVLLSGAYHKLSKQLKADRARTNAINAGVLATPP